jgi:hypothetical protein
LEDDTQAWLMDPSGGYTRAGGAEELCAQTRLLTLFDERIAFLEP